MEQLKYKTNLWHWVVINIYDLIQILRNYFGDILQLAEIVSFVGI